MLPYSINSLSRPNEFLSALALCNLCVSPLGIVAFFLLSVYLNKAANGNCSEWMCVCVAAWRHPFPLVCSYESLLYLSSRFAFESFHYIKIYRTHQVNIQTDNTIKANKNHPNNRSPKLPFTPQPNLHPTAIKNESPRPRPLRPLPRHLHPPRHRLLRRHDLLHPRRRRQQLRLQHRRPTRRTHRRHLLPQIRLRQPEQRPPLRLLHLHL